MNNKAENKKVSSANLYLREDLGRETALAVSYDSDYDSLYVGFRTPSFTKTYSRFVKIFYSANDTTCVEGILIRYYQVRVKANPNNEKLFGEDIPFNGILNSSDIQDEVREGKSFTRYYSLYEVLQLMGQIF